MESAQTMASLEEKLFFEGKYEQCLAVIRNSIANMSDYDDSRESLAILGSQCLFELGRGSEIRSFFEISYRRQLLLLPPTVFFVFINYLFHSNQYEKAIDRLTEFQSKGKPMSNNEYTQWVELIVCDGFINHRKYNKAIKFLKKQHRLKQKMKDLLMARVKNKMKKDSAMQILYNSDDEIISEAISDYDDDQKVNEMGMDERKLDFKQKEKQLSTVEWIQSNMIWIMNVIKSNIDRKVVFNLICIAIMLWILIKIAKKNKRLINEYLTDFRDLLVMSIGKSRISL